LFNLTTTNKFPLFFKKKTSKFSDSKKMGKSSLFSRKTSRKRQLKRRQRHKLRKEIEIGDAQIQLNDYKKDVEASKEKAIEQMNKLCRENENLLKWIDVYAKEIEIQKKRNYDLELKLYAQQSSSSSSSSTSPQSQSSSQPSFKSLDEYFKWENNQK
jgi:hypothetical protein